MPLCAAGAACRPRWRPPTSRPTHSGPLWCGELDGAMRVFASPDGCARHGSARGTCEAVHGGVSLSATIFARHSSRTDPCQPLEQDAFDRIAADVITDVVQSATDARGT